MIIPWGRDEALCGVGLRLLFSCSSQASGYVHPSSDPVKTPWNRPSGNRLNLVVTMASFVFVISL